MRRWKLQVPLTQLTWNCWPVLPRVLAVEALTDQTELEARISHALPFGLKTSGVSEFLKSGFSRQTRLLAITPAHWGVVYTFDRCSIFDTALVTSPRKDNSFIWPDWSEILTLTIPTDYPTVIALSCQDDRGTWANSFTADTAWQCSYSAGNVAATNNFVQVSSSLFDRLSGSLWLANCQRIGHDG